MKKILAATALFLALPFVITSCDERDEPNATGREHFEDYDYNNNADDKNDHVDRDENRVEDFAHDAVDGAESAVDDVIDGAGDAANDIIDGFDGERNTTETSVNSHISTVTSTTVRTER